MERFYVFILCKRGMKRSDSYRATMRLLVDTAGYAKRKKNHLSGSSLQCFRTESEKRRAKLQRRLRNKLYSKILISPLIKKVSHKDFPADMSRVPLMASERGSQVAAGRNMIMLEAAGLSGDSRTYCVERERLAEKSEWFREMLIGPFASPLMDSTPLFELHMNKQAFDYFLRYLHDEAINFMSVSTARATIDAAYLYICPELVRLAAAYLEENIKPATALEIYQGLGFYTNNPIADYDRSSNSPTAPPPPRDDTGEIAAICTNLLLKCLSVIDLNSATVLRQERFEELSYYEVAELACRDTLNLSSECILFSALDRWATAECRRKGIEPSSFNKRAVLSDDICFSVRYLLMDDREFVSGPMASGILSNEECVYIVSRILKHPESSEDDNLPGITAVHPSRLSDTPRIGTYTCMNQDCNMLKSGKKERQDNRKNRRKECANQGQKTCARIGNCLVQILACVFD